MKRYQVWKGTPKGEWQLGDWPTLAEAQAFLRRVQASLKTGILWIVETDR